MQISTLRQSARSDSQHAPTARGNPTTRDNVERPTPDRRVRPASESLREYGRGIVGGLLFSLPILYTMEVWWAGFLADPSTLLLYIAVTFLLLLSYNRYAGMRQDASFVEVAIDSIEEMGIGLVLAAVVLSLLGRITAAMPAAEILGKIVVESMTIAVGVSVGTALFSLLIGAIVLVFSGFVGAEARSPGEGVFWAAFAVLTSYTAALLASALMLWFFERLDGVPLLMGVSQIVVLAFPAMLGASAGRLLIQ